MEILITLQYYKCFPQSAGSNRQFRFTIWTVWEGAEVGLLDKTYFMSDHFSVYHSDPKSIYCNDYIHVNIHQEATVILVTVSYHTGRVPMVFPGGGGAPPSAGRCHPMWPKKVHLKMILLCSLFASDILFWYCVILSIVFPGLWKLRHLPKIQEMVFCSATD